MPELSRSRLIGLAAGLFFLSGATGLIYEVLWTRRLTLVFGHSVLAVSTVLAAYMGGLGLGSLAGGRWADRVGLADPSRTLRAYAWLEAGVGLAALLSLPALSLVEGAYVQLARSGWSGSPLHLACLLLSLLILGPPTALMGATLPILVRGLPFAGRPGRLLGGFYGLNTLGACLGAGLTGYLLLPGVGFRGSLLGAAALNLVLAWVARQLARRRVAASDQPDLLEPAAEPPVPSAEPGARLVPLALALSGGASMTLQIGWTRGLVLTMGSSTYAFAAIVTIFLAGLGLGGALYTLRSRTPRVASLATLLLLTGALSALATYLLGQLPTLLFRLAPATSSSFAATLAVELGLAALIVLTPALALGAGLPLGLDVYRAGGLGQRIASLYAANTAGCVAGSVLAGFWLLPGWGAQVTLKLACVTLLGAGLALDLRAPSPRRRLSVLMGASLGALCVGLMPAWNPALMSAGVNLYYPAYSGTWTPDAVERLSPPFWYRDGLSSTVSLHATPEGSISMRVNGKVDASTNLPDLTTMYLTGYLPALYCRPRQALLIGLGGGMTLEALCSVPGMERVDCAELEGEVLRAQEYWKGFNARVSEDPRVRLYEADGRSFVQSRPQRYDVIASEPSNVWMAGVGNLFTREFYQVCSERLNEGGVMAQWFQNYAVSSEEVGMVIRTFFEVFPYGSVWVSSFNEHDVVLIGSHKPLRIDPAWMRELTETPSIRKHLFQLDLWRPAALLGHYVCERSSAVSAFQDAPLNTDDKPVLEYRAARRLHSQSNFQGLCSTLFQPAHPLPAGIPLANSTLQDASLGWLACRLPTEIVRLLVLFPQLSAEPLVGALTSMGDQSPAQLQELFQPAVEQNSLGAYLLGRQLDLRGAWVLAEKYYARAALSPPPGGEVEVMSRLGICRFRQGRWDAAVEAFEQALARGGGYRVLTLLGDAQLQLHQPSKALKYFSRAASFNPAYVPAWWGRAQCLLALQDFNSASRAYGEVLALVPNHAMALMNLGYCQTRAGHFGAAIATYRRTLRFYPRNQVVKSNLDQLLRTRPGARFTPIGTE